MNKDGHIYLIGLSGSGKSTIGSILSKKLNRPFVDIDKMIVRKARKNIMRIFAEDGEPSFRKMETIELKKLARKLDRAKVIAIGGGGFESSLNRKLVKSSGLSIWLRCPMSELTKRLSGNSDRPLLKGGKLNQKLGKQLRKRLPNYRNADLQISTGKKPPGQVSTELIKTLKKKYAAD